MPGLKTLATLLCLTLPVLIRGDFLGDIVSAIENAVDCDSCLALLVPISCVAELGDSVFVNTLVAICEALGIEDDDVCQGVIQQQGPVLAQDLINISLDGDTAVKLCNALLGLCQPPSVNAYTVSFPKPAPSNPKSWTSEGKPPFYVAHFSDVHIDRLYTPGTESDCKKPICCRPYPDYPTATVPANQTASLHCDTSPALEHAMLASIPPTSFSIFTGDIEEDDIWLCTEDGNINNMNRFASDLKANLLGPLYPAIGNHEVAPVDLFPRNTSTVNASDAQWVFNTQASNWVTWLDADSLNQVKNNYGSYAQVVPGTSLKIISINTLYWYKSNFWLFDSDNFQPDPNGILGFLIQQLQAAEDAGQRAWIIGHMPPGGPDALYDQSNYFDQIVQRYKNTISAQFYGHSHQDQFEIAYSNYSNQNAQTATSIAMIAPSLTPRSGNPAYKYYAIDPDTYEIMDATTYYGNIYSAEFQSNPTFAPYYSVRQTWGSLVDWPVTQPLTPAFWHQLTQVFENNNSAFQQYNTFLNRGIEVPSCDSTCQTSTICGLRAMRAEDNCVVTSPGLNFKRSVLQSTPQRDSCEGTHLGHIFSKFPQAAVRAKAEGNVNLKDVIGKHVKK